MVQDSCEIIIDMVHVHICTIISAIYVLQNVSFSTYPFYIHKVQKRLITLKSHVKTAGIVIWKKKFLFSFLYYSYFDELLYSIWDLKSVIYYTFNTFWQIELYRQLDNNHLAIKHSDILFLQCYCISSTYELDKCNIHDIRFDLLAQLASLLTLMWFALTL